jgi:hypothetical protein
MKKPYKTLLKSFIYIYIYIYIYIHIHTRWFKYDRDKLWLVYTQIVPIIFEPPCMYTWTINWPTVQIIQGDQKVSVHLMITIQKVTSNVQSVPCQSPDRWLIGDWNCLKYCISACFLFCNHQVHRDFLVIVRCTQNFDHTVYSNRGFCKD